MARVLIVEDDRDVSVALRTAFRIAGYHVEGVESGAEALAACDRVCPDLVLLDLMLPDLDGIEVCARLRKTADTMRVPIVFLTARSDEAMRVRGLAAGADDYVTKPFSTPELLLRVRGLLRRATPVELQVQPLWIGERDKFRVWNGYAELHFARREWRDCIEISHSILQHCRQALTPAERRRLIERLSICARQLE